MRAQYACALDNTTADTFRAMRPHQQSNTDNTNNTQMATVSYSELQYGYQLE